MKADPKLRRIPILVLTTSADEDDVCRAYDAGVNGFMTKPTSMSGIFRIAAAIRDYWFGAATLPKAEE